jgi:hypothetical protein
MKKKTINALIHPRIHPKATPIFYNVKATGHTAMFCSIPGCRVSMAFYALQQKTLIRYAEIG